MRPLHIIMPMAGEGSRFIKEGWTIPKPLIELKGLPLFLRAVRSVTIEGVPMKYSFIVRKEHIERYQIDRRIKSLLPNANVLFVEKTTRGAVETCLMAENLMAEEDAIMVLDCDLEFRSRTFMDGIKNLLKLMVECWCHLSH